MNLNTTIDWTVEVSPDQGIIGSNYSQYTNKTSDWENEKHNNKDDLITINMK